MAKEQDSFQGYIRQISDESFVNHLGELLAGLPPTPPSFREIRSAHPRIKIEDISKNLTEGQYDINLDGSKFLFTSNEFASLVSWQSTFGFPPQYEERQRLLFRDLPRQLYPTIPDYDPQILKKFTTASVEWLEEKTKKRKSEYVQFTDILQETKFSNILNLAPAMQHISFTVDSRSDPLLQYQFGINNNKQAWIILPKVRKWYGGLFEWTQTRHISPAKKPAKAMFDNIAETINILNK